MNRRRFLAGLSAGTLAGAAGCMRSGYAGTDSRGPPRLSVDGRWLVDPDGNPVVLRGVSLADPVWGVANEAERGKGYWDTFRLATDDSAGWHARVVRIPVEPASIREVGLQTVVEEYLDPAVELAAERGAYALLDYQAIERYDTPSIDRRLRAFWNAVAPRYAEESHVLYELFSEPTEPAGGLEAWRTWRHHASPWVSLVRDHAPDTPIVVGSPSWSSLTAHAAREPFDQDGLLYAAHVYPSWSPTAWEGAFGTPALEVPVFVTEWGYATLRGEQPDHLAGTTEEWGEPFRQWVDAHENVHWCATTFDSSVQPAMFDTEWTTLGGTHRMGTLTKEWLADRRDDHQPGTATPIPDGPADPPTSPPDLRLAQVGETTAVVEWDAPAEHEGGEILQYRVTVGGSDRTVLRGTERSTVVRGLDPNQRYLVELTAVDVRGGESPAARLEFETLEPDSPDAVVPRVTIDEPALGQLEDVWAAVSPHPISTFQWGNQIAGDADWRAAWTEETLYVLFRHVEPDDVRQNVLAELYLDLDNSGDESYDGRNDLQALVYRDDTTDPVQGGTNSAPVMDTVEVDRGETDEGWYAEFAVPWRAYGVRPIVGQRVGLDVHLVLRNEAGERVGKRGWFDTEDEAWRNPSAMGTVELGG